MLMGLGGVVQFMLGRVHTASRNGMQQRLPQMGAGALHQGDVGLSVSPELVAEPCDEFQSGSAATDDDDAMPRGRCRLLNCRARRHRITPLNLSGVRYM